MDNDNIDNYDITSKKDEALKYKEDGNNYYKNGNYNDALISFNNAINLDPDNEIFYCNIGFFVQLEQP